MDNGAESYRRYLAGDDAGLTELVGAYKDALTLYLRGYVGDLSAAEELCEDTFFRLITKRPTFSGKSSFRSWLYAIGRHAALDSLRRGARLSPVGDAEAVCGEEQSLEASYLREERRILLHRALSQLRPEYRGALWLVYFEEFSHSEAAVALGKNERQLRNLLYRAKLALKEELSKEGVSYEEL